jgi:uncharacterized protein YqjF (DUF2071 family)
MFVRWTDLLLASWRVPLEQLRDHVPRELEVDSFDGSGWVSIVPFTAEDMHFRGLPPVPGQANFFEMNVRTYVRLGDSRGVYFVSLDCPSELATLIGGRLFHLPFKHADMSVERREREFRIASRRVIARGESPADFVATFTPAGEPSVPLPGTLEEFLTSRLSLFVVAPDRRLYRGDIRHAPWLLQPAAVSIEINTVSEAAGLRLSGPPVHSAFAARTDSLVYPPVLVGARAT